MSLSASISENERSVHRLPSLREPISSERTTVELNSFEDTYMAAVEFRYPQDELARLVPRPERIAHVWLGLSRAGFVARRLHNYGYAPSSRLATARNPRRQP